MRSPRHQKHLSGYFAYLTKLLSKSIGVGIFYGSVTEDMDDMVCAQRFASQAGHYRAVLPATERDNGKPLRILGYRFPDKLDRCAF